MTTGGPGIGAAQVYGRDQHDTSTGSAAGPAHLQRPAGSGKSGDTIDAVVLDLRTAGVVSGDVDALTGMAVKLYAKWKFDFLGKGEQHHQAYESLKAVLAMDEGYNTAKEDGSDG